MQKFLTISSFLFIVLLSSFAPVKGIDDVISSLKTGNATELAKYVDDNIEISLPDKTDTYSRSHAVMILQNFFNSNGVKGFDLKHKGENGPSQYCTGTLITRSGNYRTTVFMKHKGERQTLQEIRFENL